MASQFGFCPNCGIALTATGQAFCPNCGHALRATTPVVAPPAVAASPPAPTVVAPPDGVGWAAVNPAAVTPVAKGGASPVILFGLGLLLVVALGVGAYFLFFSGGGSISFTPSTFSCSNPTSLTITMKLPSSVKSGDMITSVSDGAKSSPTTVENGKFTKQSDGTWQNRQTVDAASMATVCQYPDAGFGPGKHTFKVLDSSGKVLAEGSLTVNP